MNRSLLFFLLALISCQPNETGNNIEPMGAVVDSVNGKSQLANEKKFSLDEIHRQFIVPELLSYLERTHPTWSVPDQNKWYPQLFNKYKTKIALVSYVSGNFDCTGKTDYALIVDKGNNTLAAVAFLGNDSSFKTVELTDLPRGEGEKIDFALTLYKPGKYTIADPDLKPSDSRRVTFNCNGVGIGTFKELYEGGDQVYYWDKKNLLSCVIEH
jgi:hypothetical protein